MSGAARSGKARRHEQRRIVIDMLNPYEHEDADVLMGSVRDALPAMRAALRMTERNMDADVAPAVECALRQACRLCTEG